MISRILPFRLAWNAAVAVSALLFVAICALWVRSYWVADRFEFPIVHEGPADARESRLWVTFSERGGIGITFGWEHWDTYSGDLLIWRPLRPNWAKSPAKEYPSANAPEVRYCVKGFGFEFLRAGTGDIHPQTADEILADNLNGGYRSSGWAIVAPHGIIALILAMPPLCFAWIWRRWSKAPSIDGSIPCRACGYDLRATPAKCPECGVLPGSRTKGRA